MQFPEQLNPSEDDLRGTAAHCEHCKTARGVRSEIWVWVRDDVSHEPHQKPMDTSATTITRAWWNTFLSTC